MNTLMTADLMHLSNKNVREPLLLALLESGEIYQESVGISLSEWAIENQDNMAVEDLGGILAVLAVIGWACENHTAAFKFGSQAYALDSNLGELVVMAVRRRLAFSAFGDMIIAQREEILADREDTAC